MATFREWDLFTFLLYDLVLHIPCSASKFFFFGNVLDSVKSILLLLEIKPTLSDIRVICHDRKTVTN